jgi:hypothetical protein
MGIIERKIILHSARASQAATLVQKEARNLLLQEENYFQPRVIRPRIKEKNSWILGLMLVSFPPVLLKLHGATLYELYPFLSA